VADPPRPAGLSARRRAEIAGLVAARLMTVPRAFALVEACRELLRLHDRDHPPPSPPVAPHPDQLPLF